MGKTITEKIMARTCGKKEVVPGEVHWFTPDYLLVVEFYAGTAIDFWQKDLAY